MSTKPGISAEWRQRSEWLHQLFQEAVAEARAKNRALGIPNATMVDGRIQYELPDGSYTDEDPFVESPEDADR